MVIAMIISHIAVIIISANIASNMAIKQYREQHPLDRVDYILKCAELENRLAQYEEVVRHTYYCNSKLLAFLDLMQVKYEYNPVMKSALVETTIFKQSVITSAFAYLTRYDSQR